jgi:diguanylate cyclase (GGDEF)-like protein/PAS domain S-box-containing protein
MAMLDGVVITDARGAIIAVNNAFVRVTGYSCVDVIGRNPSLLQSGKHDRAFYAKMWASVLQSGSWQGEIWNRRKSGEIYPEWLEISSIKDARGHVTCYLGVSRDITSPKSNEDRLKHLSQYDPLTGLPNRHLFLERLGRVLSSRPASRRLAVLFIDLDHFKNINDQSGHAVGDAFLQAVGARLRGSVRRSDTMARWSGDEFVVLLNPVTGLRGASRVARKILQCLRRPFSVQGRRAKISASIGGCLFDGKASAKHLLDKADRAMYAVKKFGRNDIQFWAPAASSRRCAAGRRLSAGMRAGNSRFTSPSYGLPASVWAKAEAGSKREP